MLEAATGVTIRRFEVLAPAARTIIEARNAELSSRYPGAGATHFRSGEVARWTSVPVSRELIHSASPLDRR